MPEKYYFNISLCLGTGSNRFYNWKPVFILSQHLGVSSRILLYRWKLVFQSFSTFGDQNSSPSPHCGASITFPFFTWESVLRSFSSPGGQYGNPFSVSWNLRVSIIPIPSVCLGTSLFLTPHLGASTLTLLYTWVPVLQSFFTYGSQYSNPPLQPGILCSKCSLWTSNPALTLYLGIGI